MVANVLRLGTVADFNPIQIRANAKINKKANAFTII